MSMAQGSLSTGNVNQSSRKRDVAKKTKQADLPKRKGTKKTVKKRNVVSY